MVNCSYCGKQLDRKVFCSNSHKVMYHKAPGEVAETPKKKPQPVKPDLSNTPTYNTGEGGQLNEYNPAPKPKK